MPADILKHYFGTGDMSTHLKKYAGRPLFFIQYLFLQRLIPQLQGTNTPKSTKQFEEILMEQLDSCDLENDCQLWAKRVVEDFYSYYKSQNAIITAVEGGVAVNAGIISRSNLELRRTVNMTLSFVSVKYCFIRERFMLEALAKHCMCLEPELDPFFKVLLIFLITMFTILFSI